MNRLSYVVVLVLLGGSWAQMNMQRIMCDSPESEMAAQAAQDYLNNQHKHGYKFALNRIEDVKIFPRVSQEIESDPAVTSCEVAHNFSHPRKLQHH